MIFGFNTDVQVQEATYHVQTEDRGAKNPVVDSIIYLGGKIIDRVRTPYDLGQVTTPQVEAMVRAQHREVVESIRAGVVSLSSQRPASAASPSSYAIRLLNPADIERNGHLHFELSVWDRANGSPVKDAALDVRCIPEGSATLSLALKTGEDGRAIASFPIPEGNPELDLLVCAVGPEGREVVKFRVRGSSV